MPFNSLILLIFFYWLLTASQVSGAEYSACTVNDMLLNVDHASLRLGCVMSSQSGISISSELAQQFPSFVGSSATAAILKLNHEKEHVELEHTVTGSLVDVQKKLLPGDEARYLILRHPKGNFDKSTFLFAQFMPDKAPLSSKMKYASSHATIHRQLGGSSTFSTSIFWTELNEVSQDGLNAHFAHESAPAPLTEEEQSLATAVEYEKAHGTQSAASQAALVVRASVSAKAKDALTSLKDNEALIFTISQENQEESIDLVQRCSTEELSGISAKSEGPSFAVANIGNQSPVFAFICPKSSSIRERMTFASTRIGFYNQLKQEFKILTNIETYEPEKDLKLSNLKEAVGGTKEEFIASKPKFNRPRPPRRTR